MRIGGLQKFSMIDYPGLVSAIVFTTGCNFRCGFCHNPELVQPDQFPAPIPEEEVLDFLRSRRGKLQAVVITGGEPTIHADLPEFIRKIKDVGFKIKLDSQGTNPTMLEQIIQEKLVNYLAMDIKGPLDRYQEITNMPVNRDDIKRSIELLMKSGIPYEFRTTIVREQLSPEDILRIGDTIKGANQYYLQKFIPTKANDSAFLGKHTYTDQEFAVLRDQLHTMIKKVGIR
ncbi:MAG: anaerobic ribonucleoside-triphosphate reductase activating protein [Patescibacteria group bacterium]